MLKLFQDQNNHTCWPFSVRNPIKNGQAVAFIRAYLQVEVILSFSSTSLSVSDPGGSCTEVFRDSAH